MLRPAYTDMQASSVINVSVNIGRIPIGFELKPYCQDLREPKVVCHDEEVIMWYRWDSCIIDKKWIKSC